MRRMPLAEIKVQDTSINSNIIPNSRIEPKIFSNQGFSFSKQISQENNISHRVITPKEFHGYPLDALKQANTTQFRVESPSMREPYSPDKQSNNHESDDNDDKALKSIKKASILNKMKHKSKFNAFIRRQSGIPVKTDLNADQPKVKFTLLYHVTPQKLLCNVFEKKHQNSNKKTSGKTDRNIKIEQVIACNLSKKEEVEYMTHMTHEVCINNKFSDSDNNNTHQMEKNVVLINSLNPNISSLTMKGIKINFNQNIDFPSLKKANYRNL